MQMTDFCDHLYDESTDGYIQILKLDDKNNSGERTIKIYNTKNDGLRDIVEELHKKEDVFLAPNTMYIPKRRVENIRQFRALFQDIDCESMGLEKAETVYMIWIMHYEGKIPKPTMVTDSGRGVHLYWRIQNAPFGALNTWQELQDYIYYNLKHLGADRKATDGARVLRLPGTINSKSDTDCKVLYIDNDVEYSMYELREEYLNYKPKTHQLKMQQTKKIDNKVISNRFFNSYSLHMERANDLETLCRLRKYEMTGYRNMAVHCFAYWKGIYVRDNYELENVVIEFNNAFTEPLKETEVQAVLRCIPKAIDKFIAYEQGIRSGERKRVSKGMRDKDGYWYKNETLIDRLGITKSEQKHMKTIIGIDEKYDRNNERRRNKRRNEEGLTKRQIEQKKNIDNIKILKSICDELDNHFDTYKCSDGEDALYQINQNIYDLIILDIMLPGINGLDILKSIRKNIETPVLILTAKEELDDKVKAFEIGANDYLTKPFYMEELVARVYAILRTTGKLKNKNVLQFKDLHVDINEKRVFINDCEIELQNKQFNLLEYFLLNKGCILLKEQIYDRIWGFDSDSTIEIVEVYISNLRKKLSKFGYDKYIKTKRKVGYIFDDK